MLQHAFGPDLRRSWPRFDLFPLEGVIGNAVLTAPASCRFEFESDGRTVAHLDREGRHPQQLSERGYDLCFPLTVIPFDRLRRDCEGWRLDRRLHALGTMPFLFPSYADVWPKHVEFLQETFGMSSIYAFLPKFELWTKPFEEWTEADWADRKHFSLLWDITTGRVTIAQGVMHIDEMRQVGKTFEDFVKDLETVV